MSAGKDKSAGKGAGRPTKYDEQINDRVHKLCLLGATDAEIAEILGIAVSTLNLWKTQHPIFMESIKEGKRIADGNVAASLYQRAIGYDIKEEKDGKDVVTRHIPADPIAAMFWLKNRNPENWRDRKEITGPEGTPLLTGITVTLVKPDKAEQ